MTMLVYALVLTLTLVVGEVVATSCTGGTVNGCSTVVAWVPFKKRFTPSCNKHDVCYGCGVQFGKSRLWCDNVFRTNMIRSCGWWHKASCGVAANVYYKAVRVAGKDRYRTKPHYWCRDPWVKGCL